LLKFSGNYIRDFKTETRAVFIRRPITNDAYFKITANGKLRIVDQTKTVMWRTSYDTKNLKGPFKLSLTNAGHLVVTGDKDRYIYHLSMKGVPDFKKIH